MARSLEGKRLKYWEQVNLGYRHIKEGIRVGIKFECLSNTFNATITSQPVGHTKFQDFNAKL